MAGYLGSKNGPGVYQVIINLMPPHDLYVEPFFGSGSLMLKKPPSSVHIGVEIDPDAVNQFDYKWLPFAKGTIRRRNTCRPHFYQHVILFVRALFAQCFG